MILYTTKRKEQTNMRKKVIILVLCAMLALSGCGGTNSQSSGNGGQPSASIDAKDRLSPEEYRSKLLEVMQEYFDNSDSIYKMIFKSYNEEEVTIDINAVTPYVEDIKKCVKDSRESIAKFSTVIPPEKYDQQHAELLETLKVETGIIDTYESMNKAVEEHNEENFNLGFSYLEKYYARSQYMTKIGEIVHALREDIS